MDYQDDTIQTSLAGRHDLYRRDPVSHQWYVGQMKNTDIIFFVVLKALPEGFFCHQNARISTQLGIQTFLIRALWLPLSTMQPSRITMIRQQTGWCLRRWAMTMDVLFCISLNSASCTSFSDSVSREEVASSRMRMEDSL